jgi:hypothetical protein
MPGKAGVYLTGYGTAECHRQNADGRTPTAECRRNFLSFSWESVEKAKGM